MLTTPLSLTFLIGPPGSGKSTITKAIVESSNEPVQAICYDQIRELLGVNYDFNSRIHSKFVVSVETLILNSIKEPSHIIFDATGTKLLDFFKQESIINNTLELNIPIKLLNISPLAGTLETVQRIRAKRGSLTHGQRVLPEEALTSIHSEVQRVFSKLQSMLCLEREDCPQASVLSGHSDVYCYKVLGYKNER